MIQVSASRPARLWGLLETQVTGPGGPFTLYSKSLWAWEGQSPFRNGEGPWKKLVLKCRRIACVLFGLDLVIGVCILFARMKKRNFRALKLWSAIVLPFGKIFSIFVIKSSRCPRTPTEGPRTLSLPGQPGAFP